MVCLIHLKDIRSKIIKEDMKLDTLNLFCNKKYVSVLIRKEFIRPS